MEPANLSNSPQLKSSTKPRLCFVGPHLSRHKGWVTTQSEVVAELFAREGYEVRSTSSVRQPLLRSMDMLRSLAKWKHHIDFVVLSVFSGRAFLYADIVSAFARQLGLPLIQFLHGGDLPEAARQTPQRMRRVLGRAEAVIAPSPFLQRMVQELELPASVIPNVLDLDAYPFQLRDELSTPLKILWLRTFHPIYNPELAVEAVHCLRNRGVDAHLTLAGQDKGLESVCRHRVEALGLGTAVRFAGFLDMKAKERELANHDLYLHTNRVDNTPVTLLEAAACGLPVIATRVGGIPDLLQDAGVLVPPDDADAMANAIEQLMSSPSSVRRFSQAGRALAERCAWHSVHSQWQQLFDQLRSSRSRS